MPALVVMLSASRRGTFRRCLRDSQGEITDVLLFEPQEAVQIEDALVSAIAKDIGHALTICTANKMGQYKPDLEATKKFMAEGPPKRKAAGARKAKKSAAKPEEKPVEPQPADEPIHGESVSE